ncbi:hypothetical protein JMJ58_08755 [Haloterrigena salifodinae]|uniref:Uncharacterized protein n=1 Tax=Haloterrigena salifodinae TaxID=2675099 RepID=A0A8T8E647_9EURY|nr:hypothetical protein [Haloterrigena salifodinae]QRV16936.1 hypothetical protein JMJ58_08755 [Haloterrigena salifodinae]
MRELRRCDFCGGDAAGAFEIVPPELEPTEAEQRRVVLCADCKNRLQTLTEPLLARAGADGESSAAAAEDEDGSDRRSDDESGDGDRAGESTSESGTVVASADESTPKRSRASSPNATVSDAAPGESDAVGDDVGANNTESDGAEAEAAATDNSAADAGGDAAIDSESLLEDGITFEHSEPANGESDTPETASTTGEETDDTAESDDERSGDAETGASADRDESSQPPAAYGKVLRLLRNREFPMQRSAVESLAAGAYDLESSEVDAIIDHAIERDEFVEKRGELRRPDA